MKNLNKLLFLITLLIFAQSDLCCMKFMPLGQATFNLNKKIKEADTDQKKLNLLTTDEFKTLVLRADRLSPADKNALPVITFIKEKIYPIAKGKDRSDLDDLFKKLRKNKLYPAIADLAKDLKGYERVGEEEEESQTTKDTSLAANLKTADDLLDLSDDALEFLTKTENIDDLNFLLNFIEKSMQTIKKWKKENITKVKNMVDKIDLKIKPNTSEKAAIKKIQDNLK